MMIWEGTSPISHTWSPFCLVWKLWKVLCCLFAYKQPLSARRQNVKRTRDFKMFGLLKFAHTADHIPHRREWEKRPVWLIVRLRSRFHGPNPGLNR